ncbi:MAG: NAD-dependent epimerase/dehydratase family protein [Planctomycetes bacterium]|nr:NAD-dependent epimerase/dehydratase family protein [Planctomycetota bacterium]
MADKTAFVTGAGGCVGRQLLAGLLADGWAVTALLMEAEAATFAFRDEARVTPVVGTLNDVQPASIPPGAAVFHLAAQVHTVPRTAEQRQRFFVVNRDGTARLADAARKRGAGAFVFVSTIAVYGDRLAAQACDEQTPPEPTTPYGQSKLEAERALAETLRGAVPYVILRPAVIYGPGDRGNFLRLITAVLGGRFPVVDGGKALKNTLYVGNLARTLAFFGANAARFDGEVFNVADPEVHSMRRIAETVAAVAGVDLRLPNLSSALLKPFALAGDALGALLRRELPLSSRRLRVMTADSVVRTDRLQAALGGAVTFLTLEEGLRAYLKGSDAPAVR